MLNITKIQQDIERTRQDIAQSQATVEKMRKENAWFPWLQIVTAICTDGIMLALIQYFAPK